MSLGLDIVLLAAILIAQGPVQPRTSPCFNPQHDDTMNEKRLEGRPDIGRIKDLTGRRFGRLLVIEISHMHTKPCGQKMPMWTCACDCGKEKVVPAGGLLNSGTQSCGCLWKEKFHHTIHGCSKSTGWTPEYRCYASMLQRCLNKKSKNYPGWGGRGIKICSRWLKGENGKHGFECFFEDMGERPKRHTLHRVENDGDYEPTNCVWATSKVQGNKKRNNRVIEALGRKRNLQEWADDLGVVGDTIDQRLKRGWSVEEAVSEPKYQIGGKYKYLCPR